MMFCDKIHVNQLTALLLGHGFQDIVVCPGSRNGILVHNFNEAQIQLHPVTDERSAAFVAMGLSLSTQRPVALCVTSGSALLNTIPAIAEAYFRHIPILVISADRPKQWIGQLDGQTLPQNGALQPYAQTFNIEEPHSDEETHWNVLRMNEAILSLQHHGGQPVHINVPITEPLFTFHTPDLPQVNIIQEEYDTSSSPISPTLLERIKSAHFPILVIGQYERGKLEELATIEKNGSILILPEIISGQDYTWRTTALEHILPDFDFHPDLVIHIGGNLVNKQLKLHLRRQTACSVIRIEPGEQLPDTFGNLQTVVRTSPEKAIHQLAGLSQANSEVRRIQQELDRFKEKGIKYTPARFSDLGVMQEICRFLPSSFALQIANSSVIRNAAYFFQKHTHRLFCNRGTNGIEGSLSSAVGYALGYNHCTLSLIGDLSFFYDQNALWNTRLPSQLRIVLFNNGGGQIFYRLPGLDQTPALSPYVAASHQTTAKGLSESYGLTYIEAHNYEEVRQGITQLTQSESERPILLEVFTKTKDNEYELKQIKQYYKTE